MLKDKHVLSTVLNMDRLNSCSHAFQTKIQCPLICLNNMSTLMLCKLFIYLSVFNSLTEN